LASGPYSGSGATGSSPRSCLRNGWYNSLSLIVEEEILLVREEGSRYEGWREAAIDSALLATERPGGPGSGPNWGFYVLLREVRRNRPGCATLEFTISDIFRTPRFLQEETGGCRSLLAGDHRAFADWNGGTSRPAMAWWEVEWEGEPLELVLFPLGGRFGNVVAVADRAAHAEGFVRALSEYVRRPSGRCRVYSGGWKPAPELDVELGRVTWEDVVLEPEVMAGIREAVEGFAGNRAAFEALRFPWRRGILLVGPPGTGKTMVCKAAGAALPELPFLYVRDMRDSMMRPDALGEVFRSARRLAPCILVFEDLDGLFGPERRSLFLNELDGFQNNEGVLVLASSNHPERVDTALLHRPSRFDRVFRLGLPELAERREYCERQLDRLSDRLSPDLDREELVRQFAEQTAGFTPAFLKEALLSAVLDRVQRGEVRLDRSFTGAVLEQVELLKRQIRDLQNPGSLAEVRLPDRRPGFGR
jgi:hypothetical protein